MSPSIFLFLCSSFVDVAPLLQQWSPIELQGKQVTFIPTASIPESYKEYVRLGQQALEGLGLKVLTLDVSKASTKEVETALSQGDFIYVSGGNTFYLLQELKRKGAEQLIREEVEKGKPYIGESAGSMILAPSIEYVQLMDDICAAPELSSLVALGLISRYPLPHYQSYPFTEVGDKILTTYGGKLPLVPITNEQAIVVRGGEFTIVTNE